MTIIRILNSQTLGNASNNNCGESETVRIFNNTSAIALVTLKNLADDTVATVTLGPLKSELIRKERTDKIVGAATILCTAVKTIKGE